MGNIVVGAIVFLALGFVVFRVIRNARRGRPACGCGCEGCKKQPL